MKSSEPTRKRSMIDFIIYFIIKIKNDDIFALGAQLAYYLILSFIPFLMFLMTLIGFSNLSSIEVLNGMRTVLPDSVFELVKSTVIEVVDKQYTGILGMSIALAMWAASSGFRAVIKGVNKAYDIKENRSFIKLVFIAILFTFSLAIVIILTLAMLVFGDLIGRYLSSILPFHNAIVMTWNVLRYIIVIAMMILTFASIYRYTPAEKRRWREVYPGAIATTIGWIVVSIGFSYYVNNFSNYSRLYGSLGAVFVLMTWLYITSMILILGAEINSVKVLIKEHRI